MTATFADYAAQQDAKNTIYLNIVKYGLMLCDALQQDAPDGYHYSLDSSGSKYHKVFMHIGERRDSIHAFIDKKTGDVYKPATIKAPAKHVRYNLLTISSRELMFEKCDWAGGYLYLR
jgi:20S proteasome alpha/beta subunit